MAKQYRMLAVYNNTENTLDRFIIIQKKSGNIWSLLDSILLI